MSTETVELGLNRCEVLLSLYIKEGKVLLANPLNFFPRVEYPINQKSCHGWKDRVQL